MFWNLETGSNSRLSEFFFDPALEGGIHLQKLGPKSGRIFGPQRKKTAGLFSRGDNQGLGLDPGPSPHGAGSGYFRGASPDPNSQRAHDKNAHLSGLRGAAYFDPPVKRKRAFLARRIGFFFFHASTRKLGEFADEPRRASRKRVTKKKRESKIRRMG